MVKRDWIDQSVGEVELFSEKDIQSLLPHIKKTRHKYEAGYVVSVGGLMSGAALLSSFSALKAGAGIVRLFYPEDKSHEYVTAPWEIIKQHWDKSAFLKEIKRANSCVIGPGLGKEGPLHQEIETLFPELTIPCVIDADALFSKTYPRLSILTPHHGEMHKLLKTEVTSAACQAFAKEKNVTLVLKGAPTLIFHPTQLPRVMTYGDPGMATAGSGDVLSGILASLLAQGLHSLEAATLGVYLHGLAGQIAAREKTSYCMIASDIIHYLPNAFLKISSLA